jgi:hypothetical protein
MALKRVAILSPNYSGRGGATVRLIVLHTAEGARTYQDLGHYFQGDVGVSSHVGIDDTPGTIGEYVRPPRDWKAWTASNANPVAVQAELCAFAKWSTAEWNKHEGMLRNTADWIREEADRFGIPITKLTASQAQGSGRGVAQHADLGSWGGGHWDCGGAFPIDRVLDMARGSSSSPPPATPAPAPPASTHAAPAFPFPSSDYLGTPDGTRHWRDGHGGGHDSKVGVKPWQQRMWERGWTISVDGLFGPQSAQTARAFQAEKGLAVDGKVGPQTWTATWEAPVT